MAASSSSTAWRPDVSKDCDIVLNPTNSEKSRSSNPKTASSPGTCTLRSPRSPQHAEGQCIAGSKDRGWRLFVI